MRMSLDRYYVEIAKVTAYRSTCEKLSVGALLVYHGKILAEGYNGAPKNFPHCLDHGCILDAHGKCLRSVHAEQNVLIRAPYTQGSTLYTTHLPCVHCSKLVINADIVRVVYAFDYSDPLCEYLHSASQVALLQEANIEVLQIC